MASLTAKGTMGNSDPAHLSVKEGDILEFTFRVKAKESVAEDSFPSFTATLSSYGGFWGWDQSTSTDGTWGININSPGKYTFHAIAPADWDFSGIFCIDTNLSEIPKGYSIVGETAKLGDRTYDWTNADAYKDGKNVRLGIWNEYNKDSDGYWNVEGNPLLASKDKITQIPEKIDAFGDHTLKGIVNQNIDSDLKGFFVYTSLTTLPTDFTIVGKKIKVNGKEYDWSKAEGYMNRDNVQLSLRNTENISEQANPIAEKISLSKGDEIEVTFTVLDVPNHTPDFTATLTSKDTIWKYQTPLCPSSVIPDLEVKQGDSLEFTFTVTALENVPEKKFPAFTAILRSMGGFWGWNQDTSEDDSWKVEVTAPGEYSICVTAPTDCQFGGAFFVDTDLTALPEGYKICAKTAKLGEKTYRWNLAKAYKDGDHIRLSIWNEWGKDENGNWNAKTNPLMYEWEDWMAEAPWTTTATAFGGYTIKVAATQDADSQSGALYINTDLLQLPSYYSIVGKTVTIGDKAYDWSKAEAYRDTSGNILLSLWDSRSKDYRANPIAEDITIRKGDVIEVTFSVIDEPNSIPDFTATLASDQSIWNSRTPQIYTQGDPTSLSIKKGDSLEFHFTVKALDEAIMADFPSFTATLKSIGGFWGWDQDTPEDNSWQIPINAPGDYSICVTAPADWDFSGAFCIETDLTELPDGIVVSGKTAKLGDKTYNWRYAKMHEDNKHVRLEIWNEWGKNEDGKWDITFNPLGCEYTEDWMGEEWVAAEKWTTTAAALGDHTVKGVAIQDATSRSGALSVETDLPEVPKGYAVSGKTIKIAERQYDWTKAKLYRKKNGTIALSLWDAEDDSEHANPLDEEIEIKAGDELDVTFTIQKADVPLQTSQPTDTPQPTDTQKPTDTPMPTDTPKPTDTPAPTDTPEPTGTPKPTGTPVPTDTQEPTKTPDGSQTPKPDNTKKPTPLAKNKTFTSGSLKYKVTTAAKKKAPAKVSVIGLSPSGKKASSIHVKNTVSYSGISYRVTAIGSKAFKNSAKLTKATLGTNIGNIPANTFNGCKKLASVAALGITKINQGAFKNCTALKKLTLRERISVKKGAFKGCKKTIKVTGSSKKINKANVKKLKKCGYKKFK